MSLASWAEISRPAQGDQAQEAVVPVDAPLAS